ncbi:hypothetical protein BASA61_003968 [Batrachochytrium salamandrivorans]|nr:hypothetical protein BASA61_003968 [Batrachochytrium salamandrivorans]
MEGDSSFNPADHSHRRFNPLTAAWVLCSPHREKRPWLGQTEKQTSMDTPAHLPDCFLCPRNQRINGDINPDYTTTHVFDNDFPAVQPLVALPQKNRKGQTHSKKTAIAHASSLEDLFQMQQVSGVAKVICFSPNHSQTMAQLDIPSILAIIEAWIAEMARMAKITSIRHIQIFENKGDAMGCSNPHPHCQMWGTDYIPDEPSKELSSLRAYRTKHTTCMLCDYASAEIFNAGSTQSINMTMSHTDRSDIVLPAGTRNGNRVVHQTQYFICVVPFWAVWPFETLVMPICHVGSLFNLSDAQRVDLAEMIKVVTCKYDGLFRVPFPYSMGIHQAPVHSRDGGVSGCDHCSDSGDCDGDSLMHFHIHFYPPLLRSATIRKFLVGFEMMAEAQRDLTPESAAERLRGCPNLHYTDI